MLFWSSKAVKQAFVPAIILSVSVTCCLRPGQRFKGRAPVAYYSSGYTKRYSEI